MARRTSRMLAARTWLAPLIRGLKSTRARRTADLEFGDQGARAVYHARKNEIFFSTKERRSSIEGVSRFTPLSRIRVVAGIKGYLVPFFTKITRFFLYTLSLAPKSIRYN